MISRTQRVLPVVVWVGLYTALALVLAWSQRAEPLWLGAAWLVSVGAAIGYWRVRTRLAAPSLLAWALGFLGAGLIASSAVAWQLHGLSARWERLQTQRTTLNRAALDRSMAAIIKNGESTVNAAAQAASVANRSVLASGRPAVANSSA